MSVNYVRHPARARTKQPAACHLAHLGPVDLSIRCHVNLIFLLPLTPPSSCQRCAHASDVSFGNDAPALPSAMNELYHLAPIVPIFVRVAGIHRAIRCRHWCACAKNQRQAVGLRCLQHHCQARDSKSGQLIGSSSSPAQHLMTQHSSCTKTTLPDTFLALVVPSTWPCLWESRRHSNRRHRAHGLSNATNQHIGCSLLHRSSSTPKATSEHVGAS
jgi:hypothetical protein